jgi:hypothetical protein
MADDRYADKFRDMLVRFTFRTRVRCRRCGSTYIEIHRHCPLCRRMYSYEEYEPLAACPHCGVPLEAS